MARPKVRIEWKGDKYVKQVAKQMLSRSLRAAHAVANQAKRNVATEFASSGPSAPGAFPHKRTGEHQKRVKALADGNRAIVAVSAPHSGHLEHGTSRMAARPTLVPTLRQMRSVVRNIFLKPISVKV